MGLRHPEPVFELQPEYNSISRALVFLSKKIISHSCFDIFLSSFVWIYGMRYITLTLMYAHHSHVCTHTTASRQTHADRRVYTTLLILPALLYFLARVCCSVLQCVAVCCSVLQCVAVGCSVLQWVARSFSFPASSNASQWLAMCCSVLQCVAVCCGVLQCVALCVAVCCSVLPRVAACVAVCCSALQCVAVCCLCCSVCCSVLQCMLRCVAACCGVLQCLALYCSACCSVCCTVSN